MMPRYPSVCQGLLGLAGTAIALLANARQEGAAPSAPMARVEVRAAADVYDARRDDTAAKIVINSAELQKYSDASVADALKRVPGVTATSTGRGSDIRMRGLAGYTLILVDGERAPAGFSIDSLAPAQVERIEVLPSASAELSTESIAGTINIVLVQRNHIQLHPLSLSGCRNRGRRGVRPRGEQPQCLRQIRSCLEAEPGWGCDARVEGRRAGIARAQRQRPQHAPGGRPHRCRR